MKNQIKNAFIETKKKMQQELALQLKNLEGLEMVLLKLAESNDNAVINTLPKLLSLIDRPDSKEFRNELNNALLILKEHI